MARLGILIGSRSGSFFWAIYWSTSSVRYAIWSENNPLFLTFASCVVLLVWLLLSGQYFSMMRLQILVYSLDLFVPHFFLAYSVAHNIVHFSSSVHPVRLPARSSAVSREKSSLAFCWASFLISSIFWGLRYTPIWLISEFSLEVVI